MPGPARASEGPRSRVGRGPALLPLAAFAAIAGVVFLGSCSRPGPATAPSGPVPTPAASPDAGPPAAAPAPTPPTLPGTGLTHEAPDPAPLPERAVRFTVRVPANTPPDTQVWLLLLPFTGWDWLEHIPMVDLGGGTWAATASLEERALVSYAYDIWDETEWSQFQERREAALRGVPVSRRLLHVSTETTEVTDVVAAWRGLEATTPAGTIRGRVFDGTGRAVVDSDVTVAGLHLSTDWDGAFMAEVAAGPQRVTVYRSDGAHALASSRVDVPAGGEVAVDFRVAEEPEVPVTFRVRLPAGTPDEVEVRLMGSVRQLGASNHEVNTPFVLSAMTRLPVLDRSTPEIAQGEFLLRRGSYVQYFYTLTSESAGREWREPGLPRFRSMIVEPEPAVREDRVQAWRNPDWPSITFRVTVPPNTPGDIPVVFEMGPSQWLTRTGPRTWEMTVSSVPDSEFRYRYLLGGVAAGADGTAGLAEGGFRVAYLGSNDVVIEDVIERWENLPHAVEVEPATPVRVTFHVSVPHTTPPGAIVRWVPGDGSDPVPMSPIEGNPWLYRADVDLPSGALASYYVDLDAGAGGRGPAREVMPRFTGDDFKDWVVAWTGERAGRVTAAGTASMRLDYLAGYYTPDYWSREFLPLSGTTFESIAAHHGNLVAVSSVWSYGRIKPMPLVEPRAVEAPSVLTPRDEIVRQISIARHNGLQVLLAPQFNMEMSEGGLDALNDNSAAWWGEWLVQAERLWMWNAQVAEETDAEMLLLPGFMFHVFAGSWAFESEAAFEEFDSRVAALVERVRSVYGGKVLISGGVRESRVPGLADYVGVTTYDTGHPDLPASATVTQWREAYDRIFTERVDPIHQRWGKPVFFYTIHLPHQPDDPDADGQASQARRLEGLMQALDSRPFIAGSLSWSYEMIDAPLRPGDGLRGRLAEAVLAKYYGRYTGAD